MVAQVKNIEDLISCLLECSAVYSGCESIKNEVADSLKIIGIHQPNTFLTVCHHYLLQNPRVC
uniref:Saposin B-type domain-containing protein n=1 Tax=Heterorhabditis bacteriophora TaxID=37862 RepID=A0A1I7WS72_HETBA